MVGRSEDLSAVGLFESIATLPPHVRLLRELRTGLRAKRYHAVILVDYPGLHLRVARAAARAGVPVLYYIPPQVWAWGGWRLRALRSHVRRLAVILPFEVPFYRERGIEASFVGHPLLDGVERVNRAAARAALGIPPERRVLALFPGSRAVEVRRLWPIMRAAARELGVNGELEIVVAAMSGLAYPDATGCRLVWDNANAVMQSADAGICKSGTTTLAAALADMPMIITYRMHALTAALARRLAQVTHIGLVNLVAGREIVPELLQERMVPGMLAKAVAPLLDPASPAAADQRDAFKGVRAALGRPGASARVAEMALEVAA